MSHDEPIDPFMQEMQDALTRDRALTFDNTLRQVSHEQGPLLPDPPESAPRVRDDSQHPLNKLARGESVS
ncbi:MAG: hypothetical protein WA045_10455 [Nitrospira sp.]